MLLLCPQGGQEIEDPFHKQGDGGQSWEWSLTSNITSHILVNAEQPMPITEGVIRLLKTHVPTAGFSRCSNKCYPECFTKQHNQRERERVPGEEKGREG